MEKIQIENKKPAKSKDIIENISFEERQEVKDFIKGLNQLTKDTGIIIRSFDWSSAMIEAMSGGDVAGLHYDETKEEYEISYKDE